MKPYPKYTTTVIGAHSVPDWYEALDRLVTHAAYHVGQIVFLAKHFAGPGWTTLTIPKKKRNT